MPASKENLKSEPAWRDFSFLLRASLLAAQVLEYVQN